MNSLESKQTFLTPPRSFYNAQKMQEHMMRAARQEDEEIPLPPMPPYNASRQVRRAWERQCQKIEKQNRRRRV